MGSRKKVKEQACPFDIRGKDPSRELLAPAASEKKGKKGTQRGRGEGYFGEKQKVQRKEEFILNSSSEQANVEKRN